MVEQELCPPVCPLFPASCLDTVLWEQGLALPAWKRSRGGLRTGQPSPLNKPSALAWPQWEWGQLQGPAQGHTLGALGTCSWRVWDGLSPLSEGGKCGNGSFLPVGKLGVCSGIWVAVKTAWKSSIPSLRRGSRKAAPLFFLTWNEGK